MPETPDPAPPSPAAQVSSPAVEELRATIAELSVRARSLSWLRLFLFGGAVAGGWAALEFGWAWLVAAGAGVAGYIVTVILHGRALDQKTLAEHRKLLSEEADARRRSRKGDRRPPAVRSSPLPLEAGQRIHAPPFASHPLDSGVIDDLQLLEGPRTLWAFIDRTSSVFGAWRLEQMMTHLMASPAEIRERQHAVGCLARDRDLRQRLLETLVPLRQHDLRSVPAGLRAPLAFVRRRGLLVLADLMGTLAPLCLALTVYSSGYLSFLFLLVVLNGVIVGVNVRRSNPGRDRLLGLLPVLRVLGALDPSPSGDGKAATHLAEIRDLLLEFRGPGRALQRRIGLLGLHSLGIVFEVLNLLTLWELRILPRAERLLHAHRELVERALGALAELEAILSLALPLAEQENFVLPGVLEDEAPSVVARAMGHPLLDGDVVVTNDLEIGGGERIWIVTGSNMAGKSTYLKAAGVNLVLASMGGPVCAAEFRWTPLRLYSDINVRDSLDDGKSYFQVEVERVREVVEQADADPRLLAIFDELFRGTNSAERLAIARSILRRLRDSGALALVATHDGALTRLVSEEGEAGMVNHHFQESVEGQTMTFDYVLRDGPATTRNAIRVLEVSGYPAEITRQARGELDDAP